MKAASSSMQQHVAKHTMGQHTPQAQLEWFVANPCCSRVASLLSNSAGVVR
jgi:hypothetical protein